MRHRAPAVALVAIAVALAACSSSGSGKSAAPREPATAAVPPARPAGTHSTDPFCAALSSYSDKYGQVTSGATDPQQLRAAMQDGASAIAQADQAAPDAIRPDVDVLNTAFQQLLAVLEATNFDITKVSLAQVEQFETTQFTSAGAHVDAYVREHC